MAKAMSVRHILVPTKEARENLKSQVAGGAGFATLARILNVPRPSKAAIWVSLPLDKWCGSSMKWFR